MSEAGEEAAVKLTLEEVEAVEDVLSGFELMERHGVAPQDVTTLDDLKERLRLHYHRSRGTGRTVTAAEEVITGLREDNETKRKELRDLFEKTRVALGDLDTHVEGHLKAEGTVTVLKEDFEKHMEGLHNSECPILVAGETSSGKSSLLNLLLGEEILPHSLLGCTAVMCKLRYGPTLRAVVQGDDGDSREVALSSSGSVVTQLTEHIFRAAGREDGQQACRAVEIYLPLPILKTGVYIIDSPGFGENAAMDRLLLDYIQNNPIFAFIYVIKTDNAGGVQEDRLQRILKFIVDQQHTNHVTNFDPRAAVFVCNRWDLVPEKERDLVRTDTFEKLARCWPDLKDSQIFCLSTTKAWTNSQAGYVSEDYSSLLDGIQRLIPRGLQQQVQHSYRWLEYLLSRVLHHVSSYLAKTRISSKDLAARHKATELRLHRVEKESDVIMKRLDKQLRKSVTSVADKLADFLQSGPAEAKMSSLDYDELPIVHEDDVWMTIESDLDVIIEKRLAEIIREWDESNKHFIKVQKALYKAFKEEFLVLESQLASIEQCIQSDDISLSDVSDEVKADLLKNNDTDTARFLGLSRDVDANNDSMFDFNLSTLQKVILGFAAPVLVPVAIGMLVGAPLFLLWDFKKWRRRSNAHKNMEAYQEDPIGFIHQRAIQVLGKVAELDNVTQYVHRQLEPARLYLDSMRTAVPNLVESNRSLMDDILQDQRTSQELQERYLGYESLIPSLQELVAAYGNAHIREYDYTMEQLRFPEEQKGGFVRFNRPLGIWTDMKAAVLERDSQNAAVSVKSYKQEVSAMHLLMEEVHHRKARHPQVARVVGVVAAARGVPAMLLEGGLVHARRELFGFRALPRASNGRNVLMDRARRFLEQVGMGLEYLHYRGVVHMELSLDTVMLLTSHDQVKLTNVGEPRRADLPPDRSAPTGDYVYLPPDVLRGAIYRARSDMYSLGLMAWELWNQDFAFKSQRKSPLRDFIATGRPSMLPSDENNPFGGVINCCIHVRPEDRLCSTTWVNEMRKLDLLNKGMDDDEEL